MRVVLQRVKSADVKVKDEIVGKIGTGLLLYVGLEKGDTEKEASFIAEKILYLRIFPDSNGKMDKSILEIGDGAILSVSQFTLASYIKKGRRPDFSNALDPSSAEKLYTLFNSFISEKIRVEQGIFGSMMDVSSVNDGPVTFIIEKKPEFIPA